MPTPRRKWKRYVVVALLLCFVVFVGIRSYRGYHRARILESEFEEMQTLASFVTGLPFDQFYVYQGDGSTIHLKTEPPGFVADRLDPEWSRMISPEFAIDLQIKSDQGMRRIADVFPNFREASIVAIRSEFTGRGLANSDVDGIAKMNLSYSQVDDIGMVEIGDCVKVQELDLQHTKFTDEGLQHLSTLTELEHLRLDSTNISANGLKHLAPLARTESLKKLFLYDIPLTDEAAPVLAEFTNLEELGMRGTNMTPDAVDHLARLKNLKFLQVGSSQISETDRNRLRKALPNCTVHY